jgi:hypothetical protein
MINSPVNESDNLCNIDPCLSMMIPTYDLSMDTHLNKNTEMDINEPNKIDTTESNKTDTTESNKTDTINSNRMDIDTSSKELTEEIFPIRMTQKTSPIVIAKNTQFIKPHTSKSWTNSTREIIPSRLRNKSITPPGIFDPTRIKEITQPIETASNSQSREGISGPAVRTNIFGERIRSLGERFEPSAGKMPRLFSENRPVTRGSSEETSRFSNENHFMTRKPFDRRMPRLLSEDRPITRGTQKQYFNGYPRNTNENYGYNNNWNFSSQNDYRVYNPIDNCRSAGIIPYSFITNNLTGETKLYFLFQKMENPIKKKDIGWNDFGGKQDNNETTPETAAREFSEETSCLFFLKETRKNDHDDKLYESLKDNPSLLYDDDTIMNLKNIIPNSTRHYASKITSYVDPLYVNIKEIYISFFVKVMYIPENDLPRAEDIHINYEDKYLRTCKWFSIDEVLSMNEREFHKRLQITKIINRIKNFYHKDVF